MKERRIEMSLPHRISAIVLMASLGNCGTKSTAHVEPLEPARAVDSSVVVLDFVGEVDAVKNEIRIRPALPNEIPSNNPAPKSWSRISGAGSGTPTVGLSLGTYNTTTTAGPVSTAGVNNPYPATYSCTSGHSCGWVTITQAAGTTLRFGDAIAVVYNITNGATLENGETLPSSAPLYASALPAGGTYMRYPGGTAWDSFRWGDPGGSLRDPLVRRTA